MSKRPPLFSEPRPIRGDVHIQVERCKGCQLCVEYCPTQILAMSTEFNVKGYHYPMVVGENCICCQACFTICPEFAIFASQAEAPAEVPEGVR